MKTTNKNLISSFDNEEMNELLSETKETIAKEIYNSGITSTFAMVDLWRVQKKQKTLGSSMNWQSRNIVF